MNEWRPTRPGEHWNAREVAGRRLFFAVPLGEDARAATERLMLALEARAGLAGGAHGEARAGPRRPARGARWVRTDGLHLTLRFLGATPDAAIPDLEAALREAAVGIASFPVRLDGAGSFPPGPRPRVLWLGVGEGAPALSALAGRLEAALALRGWPRDERPFAAHLTIARTDGVPDAGALADRLRAAASDLDAAWTADRVMLFESITGGGPARYVPLVVVPLDGAALPISPPAG